MTGAWTDEDVPASLTYVGIEDIGGVLCTVWDSENGESKTVTQEEMDQIMQSSGNAYVGYLKKAEE